MTTTLLPRYIGDGNVGAELMDPVTLSAAAIATLVITKASEKVGEGLGEAVMATAGKLLALLRRKRPEAVKALEGSEATPLDYGEAVLELEAAVKNDPEVAEAVQAVEAAVKGDPKLAGEAQKLAEAIAQQPPTVYNAGKLAETIGALFQNSTINIEGGFHI